MAGFTDRGRATTAQRVIPHPAVTLAVQFGDGSLTVTGAAGRHRSGSLVAGPGFGSEALWLHGERFAAVQVRLSPLLAPTLLGVSPRDLDGAVVDLDDVWGPQAARIRERLHETDSWDERFALIEALLVKRAAEPAVDPEVAWAWKRILATHGRVRIGALADEVGWSRKRLWSRFHAHVGLVPKRAATLVRFDHAVHRLVAGEPAARVAADTGYADQSHLHRDVVAFTGLPPASARTQPWLRIDETAWPDARGGSS